MRQLLGRTFTMLQWHPKAGALVLVALLVAFAGLLGFGGFDPTNFSW